MTHPIHEKQAELNRRAEALTDALRRTNDPASIGRIHDERRVLNADAAALGYVKLFDGRFRLSGDQVLKIEADTIGQPS